MVGHHTIPALERSDTLGNDVLLNSSRWLTQRIRQEAAPHHKQPWPELSSSTTAQEEELQWMAMEVHDRIAQTLAAAFQQLQALESITRAEPKAWQVTVRASTLVREAIREARNIMNDLHPPLLDEFGVIPLIEEELRHFQEDTGCQATLNADYPARPSRDTEVALYRIFHEALINVRRHAHGTRVLVPLEGQRHSVRLSIVDNGAGFDADEALGKKRVGGLMSMQRRAKLAGGSCSIESQPGQGTRVEVRISLADETTDEVRHWAIR